MKDFANSSVDVGTAASDENGVFGCTFVRFGAELDYQCLIFPSDPLKTFRRMIGVVRVKTHVFKVVPF